MRICVTVASEVEFRTRARFVGCRTRRRTLGRPDSSDAGTRGCRNSLPDSWEAGTHRTPKLVDVGTRCRTFGRPELVGRRNSQMPESAAELSPESFTSWFSYYSFNQLLSSDFSPFWPVCSPYIGKAKLAGTRLMEGVADDSR